MAEGNKYGPVLALTGPGRQLSGPSMANTPPTLADETSPLLPRGLSELADRYDVVLCDLWGVVHDGTRVFEPALEALRRFRALGGTVVYITNAPRPRDPVLAQLAGLGVTPDTYDAIVTSGDVTVSAIAARGTDPVYHIGPERDLALFEAVEQRTGNRVPLTGLDEAAYVVVTGLFDDARETPDDYAAALGAMRNRDLTMVCANPDIVVHVGETIIYCGGAWLNAMPTRAGEPSWPASRIRRSTRQPSKRPRSIGRRTWTGPACWPSETA